MLFTYRAVEGSGNDLFFVFFDNVQNQVALTDRAGQNIHKIFFHQNSPSKPLLQIEGDRTFLFIRINLIVLNSDFFFFL